MTLILKIKRLALKRYRLRWLLLLAVGLFFVFKHTTPIDTVVVALQLDVTTLKAQLDMRASYLCINGTDFKTTKNPELITQDELKLNSTKRLSFMEKMKIRIDERRKHLRKTCNKLGINPSNKLFDVWRKEIPTPVPWMYLSKKYQMLYMEIPKCGSSNWKKLVMVLKDLANFSDFTYPRKLNPHNLVSEYHDGLSQHEKELFHNSIKVVVVREPMERLASIYLDKVARRMTYEGINTTSFGRFSWEVAKRYGTRWKSQIMYYNGGLREIKSCNLDLVELKCDGPNEVIKIVGASYGRWNNESCGEDPNWSGRACYSNSSYVITSHTCNGKSHCEIFLLDRFSAFTADCLKVKKVLTILYRCNSIKGRRKPVVTVCSSSSRKLTCSSGRVISIVKALYGRKSLDTCAHKAKIYHTDCVSPSATAAVTVACDHQPWCVVHADKNWIQSDGCPATTKYLQVWYYCIDSEEADLEDTLLNLLQSVEDLSGEYDEIRKKVWSGLVKVEKRTSFADTINKKLDNKLPPTIFNLPNNYKIYPLSATFQEFVRYLLDPANAVVRRDVIEYDSTDSKATSVRHWQSYHTLIYPCHIDYDIIVHKETVDDDARYLLRHIGAPSHIKLPKDNFNEIGQVQSATTQEQIRKLFATLSEDETKRLLDLYSIDYKLFGYELPKFEFS